MRLADMCVNHLWFHSIYASYNYTFRVVKTVIHLYCGICDMSVLDGLDKYTHKFVGVFHLRKA